MNKAIAATFDGIEEVAAWANAAALECGGELLSLQVLPMQGPEQDDVWFAAVALVHEPAGTLPLRASVGPTVVDAGDAESRRWERNLSTHVLSTHVLSTHVLSEREAQRQHAAEGRAWE